MGKLALGFDAPERLLLDAMRDARGQVVQELHTFSAAGGANAMLDSIAAGASWRLLVNPKANRALEGAAFVQPQRIGRLHIAQYGGKRAIPGTEDVYQHSKLFAMRDGEHARGVFTNVSLMDEHAPLHIVASRDRPDIAVELLDDTARAAYDVVDATLTGNVRRLASGLDSARGAGLLLDEPLTGSTHLADTTRHLVDNAMDRLVLVSKGIDDADLARSIVAAHQRGVRVSVSVRDLSIESADILQAGGVPTLLHPRSAPLTRVNALIADDVGLVSTSYHWSEMLGRGAGRAVPGRESGVLLAGDGLARLEAALPTLPEARAALAQLRPAAKAAASDGWMARMWRPRGLEDASWGAAPPQLPSGFQTIAQAREGRRLLITLD